MLTETIRIVECAARERLWEEYRRAVIALSTSTRTLDAHLTYSEFAQRVDDIEAAKARWMAARKAWEDHAGTHRCGRTEQREGREHDDGSRPEAKFKVWCSWPR